MYPDSSTDLLHQLDTQVGTINLLVFGCCIKLEITVIRIIYGDLHVTRVTYQALMQQWPCLHAC